MNYSKYSIFRFCFVLLRLEKLAKTTQGRHPPGRSNQQLVSCFLPASECSVSQNLAPVAQLNQICLVGNTNIVAEVTRRFFAGGGLACGLPWPFASSIPLNATQNCGVLATFRFCESCGRTGDKEYEISNICYSPSKDILNWTSPLGLL